MRKRINERLSRFKWFREGRGQTLVEFSLILPILLMMVLGVIEFGRLFYGFSTLQNAVRYAADVASKAPPHLGDPVPDDPYGRYAAGPDLNPCGPGQDENCFVGDIRNAARRYSVMFAPQNPSIQVYFLPVDHDGTAVVSNEVGGLVEVQIRYNIMPITPFFRPLAPSGVPVTVGARRTIVNVNFPYEVVTPLSGTPSETPATPPPGDACNCIVVDEDVSGSTYFFTIINMTIDQPRDVIGMLIGWCPADGRLLSVTANGVELLGAPADPPGVGLGGGFSIPYDNSDGVDFVMTFEGNINPVQDEQWPSWGITFQNYCTIWSVQRSACGQETPVPTPFPTQTPTNTPDPTVSPSPWPTGTVPPICGMYIASGPNFHADYVDVTLANGGTSSPNLETVVVLWGSGMRRLEELLWGGSSVWTGSKYYSARLEGLSGEFTAGTTKALHFNYGSGSQLLNWMSFQAIFDNDCYVSFSDPNQPTPPPMPTLTPTPVPGEIFLQIDLLEPIPPDCATDQINARAITYYPVAGTTDGAGISQVDFHIIFPDGNEYNHSEGAPQFCLVGSNNCVADPLDVTGAQWISGTYTLEVTSYTDSAYGSYQRTETTTFRICKAPPPDVHVEIVQFDQPSCSNHTLNVWAIAWEPLVCGATCADGDGINQVYFDITDPGGGLVFRHAEGAVCYCAGAGNCPCPAVDFSSGSWNSDLGSRPVVSGTHTLTVRASTTQGRTGEVSVPFHVCWDACAQYTLWSVVQTDNQIMRVRILNSNSSARTISHVHVSSWPSEWGMLEALTIVNNYNPNDPSPPADVDTNDSFPVGTRSLYFRFQNNVDTNQGDFHGWIELDNGCRIDF